jgi:hypothetical protein
MSLHNVPALPHLIQLNGQVSIPPPPAEDFNTLFGGVLPPAQTVTSYWGVTTYYLIPPYHPNPSTSNPPLRVVLIHGLGTPAIGLLPLATRLAAASTPTTVLIYDNWGHGCLPRLSRLTCLASSTRKSFIFSHISNGPGLTSWATPWAG